MPTPPVHAVAFASLEWRSVPMPASTAPVEIAPLPRLADGAFRAFVRFPRGWQRPGPGHYQAAEEFVVLEGDLGIGPLRWGAGGYAWVPAGHLRAATRSEAGCLAFAWFAGAPRWIEGRPLDDSPGLPGIVAKSLAVETADAPLRLHRGPEHETWLVPRAAAAAVPGEADVQWEALGLRQRGWETGTGASLSGAPTEPLLLRAWRAPGRGARGEDGSPGA